MLLVREKGHLHTQFVVDELVFWFVFSFLDSRVKTSLLGLLLIRPTPVDELLCLWVAFEFLEARLEDCTLIVRELMADEIDMRRHFHGARSLECHLCCFNIVVKL